MRRATPPARSFAMQLMDCETGGQRPLGEKSPAAVQICGKLRPHLATLMGKGGFLALLTRALALAQAEAPLLRAVQVKADGTLQGLEELQNQPAQEARFEAEVVLIAQLLGLLMGFIGEDLTLRLVREVWPEIRLDHLAFSKQGKNEKAK